MENNKRSLVKSLSWRIYATMTSIVLILLFTRDIKIALAFGFVEIFVKLLIYYMHERAWNKISWGQK